MQRTNNTIRAQSIAVSLIIILQKKNWARFLHDKLYLNKETCLNFVITLHAISGILIRNVWHEVRRVK